MKKIYWVLVLCCLLSSCQEKKSEITLGFLIHSMDNARWQQDIKLIEQKCKEKGVKVIIKNADGNEGTQSQQASEMIAQKVDVLAIVAANQNTAAGIVREANSNGIPVIAYDRLIKNCDLDYLFSFNYVKVGEMIAECVLKNGNVRNVVLLWGDANDANAVFVKDGIDNVLLEKNNNVEVLFKTFVEGWSYSNAKYDMNRVINGVDKPIDAVIACNVPLAQGACDALKDNGLDPSQIFVTAQDFTDDVVPYLLGDEINIIMVKPVDRLAEGLVDFVAGMYSGDQEVVLNKKVYNGFKDVEAMLFDPFVVDKTNYQELITGK